MPAMAERRTLQRGSVGRVCLRSCGYRKVDRGRRWKGAVTYLRGVKWRHIVGMERCEDSRYYYWQF